MNFSPVRTPFIFALTVIFAAFLTSGARAANWYVNAAATGGNNGTSPANAWTSFAQIAQASLTGGDIVWISSGTYNERFTIAKSGTSGNRITYIGTGSSRPILRGIDGGAFTDIAILNLEIAHVSTANNYPGIRLRGATRWLIEDNYFHDTFLGGIIVVNNIDSSYNIIRHNTFHNLGSIDGGSGLGGSVVVVSLVGDYNLVEYNTITLSMDRVRFFGTGNVARNNFFGATDTPLYPNSQPFPHHVDGFQSFEGSRPLVQFLWERNYDTDNKDSVGGTNGHGFLVQDGQGTNGFTWHILRFNVLIRPGGGAYGFQNVSRTYIYNSTLVAINNGSASVFNPGVTYTYPNTFSAASSNLADVRNNTWVYSPKCLDATGVISSLYVPTNFTSAAQHTFNVGTQITLPAGASPANLAKTDPLFTDGTGVLGHDDYTLQSSSPLRNASAPITTAVGTGSNSSTLTVADSKRLFDGWGIADGDLIKIGSGAYVAIASINYVTNVVTLAASRSWSGGDPVIVKGAEDVGALPFLYAQPLAIVNTISASAIPAGPTTLTATSPNPEAIRKVEFLVDGIPVGEAYTSPYSVAWTSDGVLHNIQARAYNAWASETLTKRKFNTAPRFSTQPTPSQTATAGSNVTLTANVTTPAAHPPTSFEWYKDTGTPPKTLVTNVVGEVSGATTNSLTLLNVDGGDAATYTLVVTNSIDSETSDNAVVLVGIPVITSAGTASGTYRSALTSYTITATGNPTSYSIPTGTLPNGLTFNSGTGVISGTPTQSGTFPLTIGATNGSGTGTAPLTLTIAQIPLTVTGVTGVDRNYNTLFSVALNTASAALVGVLGPDVLNVTLNPNLALGTIPTASPGGKAVTVSGLALNGSAAPNYTLIQPATTVTISPAPLTVTGITASNKFYNTDTVATLSTGGAVLVGVFPADIGNVTLNTAGASGAFLTASAGPNKTVDVFLPPLGGPAAGNYTLVQPTATATIDQAPLTVTGVTGVNRNYNTLFSVALNTASAALVGVLGPDVLNVTLNPNLALGTIPTASPGGKAVTVSGLALNGSAAPNYTLIQPATTVTISAAPLTVTGITASNKFYNTDTVATLSTGGAVLVGVFPADIGNVTLNIAGASGAFLTASAGPNKTVDVFLPPLGGPAAGNYTLVQPTATATIDQAPLTVTGITAAQKVYDQSTSATINTAGATLVGVLGADIGNVTLNTAGAIGAFVPDASAGDNKTVNVSLPPLGGSASSNYSVTATATATITRVTLTVTGITANSKVADGSATATLNFTLAVLTGVLPPDAVTINTAGAVAAFDNAAEGNGKTVTVTSLPLSGSAAGNYTLTLPVGLTANITQAPQQPPIQQPIPPPPPPTITITSQPLSQTVVAPNPASFTVSATGTALNYQWSKNGTNILGATSSTLDLNPTSLEDAGTYSVLVFNSTSKSSEPALLTIEAKPSIKTPLAKETIVVAGSDVSFSVVAEGVPAPTYQWHKNGEQIPDKTNATLTLTNVQLDAAGRYSVIVTNKHGEAISSDAELLVSRVTVVGSYFGEFSDGGSWALHVRSDSTARYLAYLADGATAIDVVLVINADGTFSIPSTTLAVRGDVSLLATNHPPLAAAAVPFTLTGRIANGQVTGQLLGLNKSFSGIADTGPVQAFSGFYIATTIGSATGTTYSIVGPTGKSLIVTVSPDLIDSATGTIGSTGQLTATTAKGAQLTVTVNSDNQTINGSYMAGTNAPVPFTGLADTKVPISLLKNLSVRSGAGTGNETLIVGFVIDGTSSKSLLVRGIGPTLTTFGVPGALSDPVLTLFAGTTMVASNDDWGTSSNIAEIERATTSVGAFSLPANSRDSVLLSAQSPGAYSIHLSGKGTATGAALIEVYDAAAAGSARLVNLSARTTVGTGDNVLIIGFVIDGNSPRRVVLRAIGPTLASFGVTTGALADPQIMLFRQGVALQQNDNWGGTSLLRDAFGAVGAFLLDNASRDAAIVVTLEPGAYTAQISGIGNTTGIALVEVYEVP